MTTLELPDDVAAALEPILVLMSGFEQQARANEQVDFEVSEREVMARIAEIEGICLGRMLQALDPVAHRVAVDGVSYRRLSAQVREVPYFTMRSKVMVKRALYRQEGVRNGPTIVPMELRAGIAEGVLTPAAAQGVAALGQGLPSREADEMSKRLGVLPYSRSEHFRALVGVGKRWGELRELYEDDLMEAMDLEDVVSVSVSVDRASVPMSEPRPRTQADIDKGVKNPIAVNLRMAFCGVLTLYDKEGKPKSCARYAHVPTGGAEDLTEALQEDLQILRRRRPELRVVALADGAVEMQRMLDRITQGHPVEATLIDFWHLLEKLGEAATAVGEHAAACLREFRERLLTDDDAVYAIAERVNGWAKRYAPQDAVDSELLPRPEALHAAVTYLANNAERMRYATLHAAGLPIGSGTVEATAKTIIGTRMRRPGARWREPGAQPVLALRALATSSPDRWDGALKIVLASYRMQITPLPPDRPRRSGSP